MGLARRRENRWQDASPRSSVWRPRRGPSKREITSRLNIKSEKKSVCPFAFRPFRTTASATALEIARARLLTLFPTCVRGIFDYLLGGARRDRPLAAVKMGPVIRLRHRRISRVMLREIASRYLVARDSAPRLEIFSELVGARETSARLRFDRNSIGVDECDLLSETRVRARSSMKSTKRKRESRIWFDFG